MALALMLLAPAVPLITGWDVRARTHPAGTFPPLNALWEPHIGFTSVPAVLLAMLGWRYAFTLAAALEWRRLLLVSYGAALARMLALARIGPIGIGDVLGHRIEILPVAREVSAAGDVTAVLRGFVDRIPYSAAPDNWPTHVAGHPPGALLLHVGLVRLGLGGDPAAGLVVTAIGATTVVAVLVTLRALGAEAAGRGAAPFPGPRSDGALHGGVQRCDVRSGGRPGVGASCPCGHTRGPFSSSSGGARRAAARLAGDAVLRAAARGAGRRRRAPRRTFVVAAADRGLCGAAGRAGLRPVRVRVVGGAAGAARALLRRRRRDPAGVLLGVGQLWLHCASARGLSSAPVSVGWPCCGHLPIAWLPCSRPAPSLPSSSPTCLSCPRQRSSGSGCPSLPGC
ncbi:hypothetical protein [Nocardioides sp. B-3]|uniref:hypothetical protein n=1 Tax=Nocardioides sp. B-3 TaxID=2895565 RepID=UPI0021539492|nr:hypothetical protein [Nocardioides sp. B-3]UUZ59313.1 hypothetical protein LP418_26235 [Nocardioides sp. B-3]